MMEEVVSKYLRILAIPVSRRYCEKLIASHPDYPSLLSISDTLGRLGIRHQAVRVPDEQLTDLTFPYLIQKKGQEGGIKLINSQNDLDALKETDLPQTSSSDGGATSHAIVLQAEAPETIADPEAQQQFVQEQFLKICSALFAVSVVMLLLGSLTFVFSWIYLVLLAMTAVGGVTSSFLFAKSVGVKNETVDAFCGTSPKVNCNQLLFSDDAKLGIFGGTFTFTEAAIAYFGFQLIVLGLLVPIADNGGSFLAGCSVLGTLALPVVGWSLYVQAVKANVWCRLCLAVDGVLIVQAALFVGLFMAGWIQWGSVAVLPVAVSVFLLVAVVVSVILIRSTLESRNRAEQAEITANRVKYSPDVFMHLLRRGRRVNTSLFGNELLIGKPNASIQITMAASLVCGPCKEGFEKAVQLVNVYPNKVNVAFRFLPMNEEKEVDQINADRYLLNNWLEQLNGGNKSSMKVEQMLKDWYALTDVRDFTEKYPITNIGRNDRAIKKLMDQYVRWFEEARIQKTPTFFVNGWELPENYKIEDMMALVPALAAYFQRVTSQQQSEGAVI